MPANRAWSRGDHEFLVQLAGTSCTASEIAEQMSARLQSPVSRNAVIGRLHRAGIRLGRQPTTAPRKPRKPREQRKPLRVVEPKPAPKPAQPVVKRRCDDIATVVLLELQPHHCRWPVGDPGTPGFGFCGDARVEGTPYCAGYNRRGTVV